MSVGMNPQGNNQKKPVDDQTQLQGAQGATPQQSPSSIQSSTDEVGKRAMEPLSSKTTTSISESSFRLSLSSAKASTLKVIDAFKNFLSGTMPHDKASKIPFGITSPEGKSFYQDMTAMNRKQKVSLWGEIEHNRSEKFNQLDEDEKAHLRVSLLQSLGGNLRFTVEETKNGGLKTVEIKESLQEDFDKKLSRMEIQPADKSTGHVFTEAKSIRKSDLKWLTEIQKVKLRYILKKQLESTDYRDVSDEDLEMINHSIDLLNALGIQLSPDAEKRIRDNPPQKT